MLERTASVGTAGSPAEVLDGARRYVEACRSNSVRPHASVLIALRTRSDVLKPALPFEPADLLPVADLLCPDDPAGPAPDAVAGAELARRHTAGSNGAELVAHMISCPTHITHLNLSHCKIGPRGFKAIAAALAVNRTIEVLDLHDNYCYAKSAKFLARTIEDTPDLRLTHLDLSNSRTTSEGAVESAVELCNKRRKESGREDVLTLVAHGNLVLEEVLNSVTHGIGCVASLFGAIALLVYHRHLSWDRVLAGAVFVTSMFGLYLASLLYHSTFQRLPVKKVFHRIDKTAVYLLIAGTYTPIAVITFRGIIGWVLLGIVWSICAAGVTLDVIAFYRWLTLKTVLYVCMGWVIVVAGVPAITHPHLPLAGRGVALLAAGGVAYTGGVYFFVTDEKRPMNHVWWHIFVLAGSFFHYLCIFFYVMDAPFPDPPLDKFFYKS
eukprot:m51a1_g12071 hypothetical protein (438) ;mRNA; f:3980-5610